MTGEDGTLIPPGTRLVNAFNKETFIFHDPRDSLPSAAFQVLLDADGSGGGNAVEHIHPESDEHFTVHAGVLRVMIDGLPTFAMAGETVSTAWRDPLFRQRARRPYRGDDPLHACPIAASLFHQLCDDCGRAAGLVRRPRCAAQTAAGPHAAHLSRPFLCRRPADLVAEGHVCGPGSDRAPQRLPPAALACDQKPKSAQRRSITLRRRRSAAAVALTLGLYDTSGHARQHAFTFAERALRRVLVPSHPVRSR
jgi:hypothetical protein